MTAAPIRAVVADESPLVRQLIRLALAKRGIIVVAEAATLEHLRMLSLTERPDVVLSPPRIGDRRVDGLVEELREAGTDVVILTAQVSPPDALSLLAAGAEGYVTRDLTPDGVADVLRQVLAGGSVLDPRCATAVLNDWRAAVPVRPTEVTADLTAREREVLAQLAAGHSTKTIAGTLGLASKTVENHTTRIFAKLGVRRRAEAVALAVREGIIPREEETTERSVR